MTRRLEWGEVREIVDRHTIALNAAAISPWHGLGLGNADVGAIVFGPPHGLMFRLAKMDLWDSRMPEEFTRSAGALRLSELKRRVFDLSRDEKNFEGLVTLQARDGKRWDMAYPCIRMAADLCVRICKPAVQPIMEHTQRLTMSDARYEGVFRMGNYWPKTWSPGTVQAFVSWRRNVLALRITMPPVAQGNTAVTLWRDPYGGRTWDMLSANPSLKQEDVGSYMHDPRNGMLPPSEIAVEGSHATLRQVIPGDEGCPDCEFVIAAAASDGEFFTAPDGEAALEMGKAPELTLFVAIASETEAPQPFERARTLSEETAALGWDALYAEHAKGWRDFWMKSVVTVDDPNLERVWVRQHQVAAMSQRSGRPAQGLFGVHVPCDSPPWRGDRHNNWPEFSSRFWGDYAANHEEQALNYTEFVHGYLPMAQRIAREIFECERGAFYPCVTFGETSNYCLGNYVSRSLYLAAIHAQNCWWHYQYFGRREFLETLAYPVMRECALFYVELLSKNEPGDYTLWPTVPAETTGWTQDFKFNRNCVEDIANVKFLMRAVLEASAILDADGDLRAAWQDILDHLAPYPTVLFNGKEEFTDMEARTERFKYNHAVPLAPMWPAEDPDVMSDPHLREVGRNTIDIDLPDFRDDSQRRHMSCLRLGLKQALWDEVLDQTDQLQDEGRLHADGICRFFYFGSALVVQEMLMTSWDGVIQVFPAWPENRSARFQDLRAKGAFLVSASRDQGRVNDIEILSEKGGAVRIRKPWKQVRVTCRDARRTVPASEDGGILSFDTEPGGHYRLTNGDNEQ